jgi:hypothetical protein
MQDMGAAAGCGDAAGKAPSAVRPGCPRSISDGYGRLIFIGVPHKKNPGHKGRELCQVFSCRAA